MATATSHRAWEMGSSSPGPTSTPRGQLPSISALTSNLPAAPGSNGIPSPASTRERDSGAWSSQPQSTRSSAYSANTSNYMSSNTNSYYMSPNRVSNMSNNSSHLGSTSHPSADYSIPPAVPSLSSPGFSSNNTSQLPSLSQTHEPDRQKRGEFPPQESRRSSIGSQVNQGLNNLQINNGAASPYGGSVNHSTTSLAQNLNRERGIHHGPLSLRNSRSSAQLPMSPVSPPPATAQSAGSDGSQRPGNFAPRIAPPIGRNPRSDVYNADEPVPGQAYAFPDAPDLEPGALPPKSNNSRHNIHEEPARPQTFLRRDSGHGSITSSIVTSDSRLPPGQHLLEDPDNMPGTHHHTLQQNQMSNLDEEDAMTPDDGAQPYSRTPALRVSHKMAERKRRSEMKDLFENLRSQIPSNQGSKSSKWEILTKASDYIKQLEVSAANSHVAEKQLRLACHDLDLTRRDNDSLRNENQRLMQELQLVRRQPQSQAPPPPPPSAQQGPPPPAQAPPPPPPSQQPTPQQQPPPPPNALYPPHYVPPPPPPAPSHDPSRSLPPLTNGVNASSSMQGVQYS